MKNIQINYINERMVELFKINHSFDDLFEIEEYEGNFFDYIEKKLILFILKLKNLIM